MFTIAIMYSKGFNSLTAVYKLFDSLYVKIKISMLTCNIIYVAC